QLAGEAVRIEARLDHERPAAEQNPDEKPRRDDRPFAPREVGHHGRRTPGGRAVVCRKPAAAGWGFPRAPVAPRPPRRAWRASPPGRRAPVDRRGRRLRALPPGAGPPTRREYGTALCRGLA